MNRKLNDAEYLTVADIQHWLNISQGKAYGLTHRKDFPVCRLGGAIRIPRAAFLAWVHAHTSNPNGYGEVIA